MPEPVSPDNATYSIDTLIARQLPEWVKQASSDQLSDLHHALKQEQESAERVKSLLGKIPDPVEFCTALLDQALYQQHNVRVDVRTALLCTVVRQQVASIFPLPPIERTVRTTSLPLLSAAMHNFAEEEVEARPLIRRRLEAPSGAVLPVSFVQFAKLCRSLDVGGRYQAVLREHLLPQDTDTSTPGHAQREVEVLLEEAQRTALAAAARLAAIKGQIDERSYLQMLRIFAPKPIVPADTTVLSCRQLYVLGKCVQGVVAVEVRASEEAELQSLIVWIPGDPKQPVRQYDSWHALYNTLGLCLHEVGYGTFFSRFISERDRTGFSATLKRLRADTAVQTALELDGRNLPIDKTLFAHLRTQRIDKLLDDARVLVVPTGDENAAARSARLASYENVGLTLLGLAGLFVPVLGEVMLGVAALQVADEVYEGYQDWQLGDREAALGHLFGVAENLALGVAVGAGIEASAQVLKRVLFVDGLTPVLVDGAQMKLCSSDITHYSVEPFEGDLRLHDGAFQVTRSPDGKDLLIRHPRREGAYQPLLERNGSGGWRHALELPQEMTGEARLLRRLAPAFANLTDDEATALLDCTGFDEARLRQLYAENAPAPARLRDALDRYRLHHLHPTMDAEAFELLIAAGQDAEEVEDVLLRRDFPGLSIRGSKEIRRQVASQDLERLSTTGRVPLVMAERVRWFVRDSRLDRACAGLRQSNAVNTDTERMALGLVQALAPWPDTLRVELRVGHLEGPLLGQVGAETTQELICIVREDSGYSVHDRTVQPLPGVSSTDSLMNALLLSMDDAQKLALGDPLLNEQQLIDKLAAYARNHRDLASRLIGQAPIAGGVRPPVRFADGRLGYPLSGRGGGSRGQASRRGIRQVFPTLDDGQLQQYLLDLIATEQDPWAHYQMLHRHWMVLRQALANWRADYVGLLDLMRRSKVVNAVRRCWRRKQGRRSDGTYALVIRGERIGHLPSLPEGVSFLHVTRLVLRDMDLEEIDADFLGRFPNLTELDLRDNRLLFIPPGLEHLTELRALRLDNNQIVLTPADNQRINTLLNLERLELNYNPLGNAPEVRRLLNLRHVGMRSAEIDELPRDIQQVPWRGIADLRENQIQQVNQELSGLRSRLQQMALHDNPLDTASEQYLNEQPGPSNASSHEVRQNPFYRQHLGGQAELSHWLAGSTGALRIKRETLWTSLRNESGSDDFFRFLHDFARSPDYQKYPLYYLARVWNVIEACEQDSELRELLFEQAGGTATCEDRLLWLFSQMELRVLVHRQTSGLSQMQSEGELLRLGRSLYRLQQVDRIAARRLELLRNTYADEPQVLERLDDIETYLAYRVRLAGPLRLPAQPLGMHYESASHVTAQDINAARVEILLSENTGQLVQSLEQQTYWQEYLRATYASRFRKLVDAQREMLEQYEVLVEAGGIDEQEYLTRCGELKTGLEEQERALIRRLTEEAYARWPL